MFSVDYPYEDSDTAVAFIETAPVDAATRRKLCHDNAAALLGLPQLAESAEATA
ncbi:hypothetical protein [Ponticoccus litoralis]|uniref:Amidohydrolase-related domain-containing protein n=2 Tax=Ponticoccus TaxID=983507 RepID=A0AAW9SVB3_9RHOB